MSPGTARGRRYDGWGHVYGLLATACGYSYPVIDAMTLFEVEELTHYWVVHPPLHLLVANWIGAKRPRNTPQMDLVKGIAGAEVTDLLTGLGPGFASGDVHDGLPRATLDFNELRGRAKPSD